MKAIVMNTHGGPEVLEYHEVEDPVLHPHQLLVKVSAAGVNFIDIYQREGIYPVELPYTPGLEGSGEVVAVGSHVDGFEVGSRVAWAGHPGSYAEMVALDADSAVAIPEGVSDVQAAQLMLQGLTAHYLTTSVFDIRPGHTALVHAAAGGVGLLLCQLIAARGGTVIGSVSTEQKSVAALAAGAHHIIRYDTEDILEGVMAFTNGEGVEVVYDGVGKATFAASLASLKPRGVLALFGQSSGSVGAFDPQLLSQGGSLWLTRPSLAHYTATPEELRWRSSELFGAVASGNLRLALERSYPLADAGEAHSALGSRGTSGKLLVIPASSDHHA